MKRLAALLAHLARPEVREIVLASGRRPRLLVGDSSEHGGDASLSADAIVQLLFAAGGSRHLESLGEKTIHWTLRVDGVGPVSVSAVQRGDDVEARFVPPSSRVAREPARAERPPSKRPPARATLPPQIRPTVPRGKAVSPGRARGTVPPPGGNAGPVDATAPTIPPARPRARRPTGEIAAQRERPTAPPERGPEPIELELDHYPRQRAEPPRHAPLASQSAPVQATARLSREGADVLEHLLGLARASGASDLHLVAGRPPLLRIAGVLAPVPGERPVVAAVLEAIVDARVPARLLPGLARDGSCDFALDLSSTSGPQSAGSGLGRFRVNAARQRTGVDGGIPLPGLKICFRLISREVPTLASLGLPSSIGAATSHHQGLIVISGPSGHGKTSTLAAVVDLINEGTTHHVITVEDPVEHVHPKKKALISQREVGTHTRSFGSALKASLREDPDVIVVGELRDTETVRMAMAASETGHLVIGTMSTPSAARTIDRLVDLFPPADQEQVRVTLAGGLRLVVAQRLVPRADGAGMAAAVELLPGSVALWNLIRDAKTFQIPSLQQRGKGLGIVRLDDSLAELVLAGTVTLDAARAVAESPHELTAVVGAGAGPAGPPRDRPPLAAELEGGRRGLLDRAGQLFKRGN